MKNTANGRSVQLAAKEGESANVDQTSVSKLVYLFERGYFN